MSINLITGKFRVVIKVEPSGSFKDFSRRQRELYAKIEAWLEEAPEGFEAWLEEAPNELESGVDIRESSSNVSAKEYAPEDAAENLVPGEENSVGQLFPVSYIAEEEQETNRLFMIDSVEPQKMSLSMSDMVPADNYHNGILRNVPFGQQIIDIALDVLSTNGKSMSLLELCNQMFTRGWKTTATTVDGAVDTIQSGLRRYPQCVRCEGNVAEFIRARTPEDKPQKSSSIDLEINYADLDAAESAFLAKRRASRATQS